MKYLKMSFLVLSLAFHGSLSAAACAATHQFCDGMLGEFDPSEEKNLSITTETQLWMQSYAKEISDCPDFVGMNKFLTKQLTICQKVECVFKVDKDGSLSGLKIRSSSGAPPVDNELLSFLEYLAPKCEPPNNIPHERGMLLEFCKIEHWRNNKPVIDVMVWSHLDPQTRGRKYTAVQYSQAHIIPN